jgi:cytochrome c553
MATTNRLMAAIPAALLLGAALLPALAAADAPAGDAARGARIAYTCFGCHGIPDYRNAYPNYRVPRLGGQHAPYLAAAIAEYRAGTRPHTTMRGQASSLSDQDAADIAAYFAATRPVASGGSPVGTPPASAAVCVSCHGKDGVGLTADYPTLAGQYPDYLSQALKAYRKGTRQNAIMGSFVGKLTDEDIDALSHYFAAQQPALSVPRAPRTP